MTMMPSTTFQIVITESWVIENAAMSPARGPAPAALPHRVPESGQRRPGVPKTPESMWDEATRKTVNAVIGMLKAAMKTTLTPILQP